MTRKPGDIDRRALRRRFERAAGTYAGAARLESEIGSRMLERLDYVRIAPERILDAGSGTAREARRLAKRYRGAPIVALDFSPAMLRRASRAGGFLSAFGVGARPLAVCADLERLPLAAASFGLVWCNMSLHALAEPVGALGEFCRVLAPEGLLMFSTLGPDTLKELRAAAGTGRVHEFLDMHDIGDRLVAAGFSAPVMDMELITMTYPGPDALLDELRATGETNALRERGRGLSGKAFLRDLRARLAAQMKDSRLSATFEVVYGHAWKGGPPRPAGSSASTPVRFVRPRRD